MSRVYLFGNNGTWEIWLDDVGAHDRGILIASGGDRRAVLYAAITELRARLDELEFLQRKDQHT